MTMKREIQVVLIVVLIFLLVLVGSVFYVAEERADIPKENKILYEQYIHSKDIWEPSISIINAKKEISNTENNNVPILMFHNVAPLPQNASELTKSLTVDPKLFESMMDYLYKNGFTPITLKELKDMWAGTTPMPKKPIVLTFDDGDKGVYQYAFPILKKYNFKFVIFLITKYTPMHTHFYMNEKEVKEMLDSGLCEVGTHTRDHVNLKKASILTKIYEIKSCTNDIKKMFGFSPTSFCYPFGGFDMESVSLLRNYGYTMAVTEIPSVATPKDNPLLLPRIRIDGREGLNAFISKVNIKP